MGNILFSVEMDHLWWSITVMAKEIPNKTMCAMQALSMMMDSRGNIKYIMCLQFDMRAWGKNVWYALKNAWNT